MKGRSLLAALMALCLFFSLAACGKTGAGEQPGDTAPTSSPVEEQGPLAVELTSPSGRPAAMTCDGSTIYHLGQADNVLVVHSLDVESGQWTEVLRQDRALENAMQFFTSAADGRAELPQGYALLGGINRDSLLDYICQLASVYCVDFEAGRCDFSKGNFDKWLELYSGYKPYDFDAHDDYLISVFSTVSFVGAESMRQRYGEDYQYMGWPNGQGNIPLLSGANGGYCMLASSQHKDAAWQLLKTLLSVEYDDIVAAIMMPVMRDDFQEAIAALPDLNEKEGLDIRPEDIEKLVNLMEGPSLAPRTSGIDAIIREEAQKYAAGQSSLDAAVASIQSRASIYMAEQYG